MVQIPHQLSWELEVLPLSGFPLSSIAASTDPSTYAAGFFGGFSAWMKDFSDKTITARDASSFPHTKIDLNEIGVIMPHDNVPGMGITANLPDIYWNAAGATYAYVFATLAPLGVEVGVSIICVGGVE